MHCDESAQNLCAFNRRSTGAKFLCELSLDVIVIVGDLIGFCAQADSKMHYLLGRFSVFALKEGSIFRHQESHLRQFMACSECFPK